MLKVSCICLSHVNIILYLKVYVDHRFSVFLLGNSTQGLLRPDVRYVRVILAGIPNIRTILQKFGISAGYPWDIRWFTIPGLYPEISQGPFMSQCN